MYYGHLKVCLSLDLKFKNVKNVCVGSFYTIPASIVPRQVDNARSVGDGVNTFLSKDPWLGDSPLCVPYSRLFDLVVNKSISVAAVCDLGWRKAIRLGSGPVSHGQGRMIC